jgi:hypothetical protein
MKVTLIGKCNTGYFEDRLANALVTIPAGANTQMEPHFVKITPVLDIRMTLHEMHLFLLNDLIPGFLTKILAYGIPLNLTLLMKSDTDGTKKLKRGFLYKKY